MTTEATFRGSFKFKVDQFNDGTPFIKLTDPTDVSTGMENPDFSFDLKAGATVSEAEEIAAYLNDHLGAIAVTFFDGRRIRLP